MYEGAWRSRNLGRAVQARLQAQACDAAELPSMPPRQAAILRVQPWCGAASPPGAAPRHSESLLLGAAAPLGGSLSPASSPPAPPSLPPGLTAQAREQLARLTQEAEGHREHGELSKARASLEAAVALAPSDFESWSGLAQTMGALGDHAEEVAAYRRALAIQPDHATSWVSLGVSLTASSADDPEAAEEAFRRAVEVAQNSDARAPLNLARYLAKLSKPAEAIDHFYGAAAIDAEYFEQVRWRRARHIVHRHTHGAHSHARRVCTRHDA